jgi:hypothetical protein
MRRSWGLTKFGPARHTGHPIIAYKAGSAADQISWPIKPVERFYCVLITAKCRRGAACPAMWDSAVVWSSVWSYWLRLEDTICLARVWLGWDWVWNSYLLTCYPESPDLLMEWWIESHAHLHVLSWAKRLPGRSMRIYLNELCIFQVQLSTQLKVVLPCI